MSNTEMSLRRTVVQMQHGQTKSVDVEESSAHQMKDYVEKFARRRKIGVTITIDGPKLSIERVADLLTKQRYGEMDGLAVGESHIFKVTIPEHAGVRRMASYRNRDGSGRMFKCTVDPEGLRVTRMPVTDAERLAMPVMEEPRRATKYGLDRLSTMSEIRFDLPRVDQQRLRLSAHQLAVKMSWTIRCRLQDDGSMLVYRTDAGAARSQAAE